MKITKSNINELLLKFCESEEIDHIQVETLVQPMHEVYIAEINTKLYDLNTDLPFQETNYVNCLDKFLQEELGEEYQTSVEYTSNNLLLIIFIG